MNRRLWLAFLILVGIAAFAAGLMRGSSTVPKAPTDLVAQ